MVSDPHHPYAQRFKPRVPMLVVAPLGFLVVERAVQLNGEAELGTVEVQEVSVHPMLAAKLHAHTLAVPQKIPGCSFSLSALAAQPPSHQGQLPVCPAIILLLDVLQLSVP